MPRTYSELYISVRNRLRDAGIEAAELEGKLIVATAAGKTTEKLLRDMRFYATDECSIEPSGATDVVVPFFIFD